MYWTLQSLEIFSDHTVYLALYEGFAAPSYERFSLAEDGTVDLRDNVTGCMFTRRWTHIQPIRTLPGPLWRVPVSHGSL